MQKQDLTVVILTFNEELHIRRCLENVKSIAEDIVVIDCFSTDATRKICEEMGVKLVEHEWPGNQAEQFNWAIDNVPIHTKWIMRLDADEYLSKELVCEIEDKLSETPDAVNGIHLLRKVFFQGKLMKHGPTISLLRIFRNGFGKSEVRIMDEHIVLSEGETVQYNALFYDDSKIDLDDFVKKHLGYAKRNAAEFLNMKYGLRDADDHGLQGQAAFKRKLKKVYLNLPLFVRPFLYFIYRYFIRGSFLEGKEGFLWCFYQSWWYSTVVDTRLWEIQKACGTDKDKIRDYLKIIYGISM